MVIFFSQFVYTPTHRGKVLKFFACFSLIVFMVRDVKIITPAIVVTTGLLAIGTTLWVEETGAEWIHAVWVVIGVSLLVDFHTEDSFPKRINRLVRKISSIVTGLALGCACGLIVRALNNWDSPRWTILLLRLVVECLLLLGSALVAQRTNRINSFELALVCLSSSLALYCSSQNLAVARVVALLFASATTLLVLSMFFIADRIMNRNRPRGVSQLTMDLVDALMTLATKALASQDTDKEEIDRLSTCINDFLAKDGSMKSIARPLLYECLSLYWSMVSASVVPFQEARFFLTDRAFTPSLDRVEDGLDGVRNDTLSLMVEQDEEKIMILTNRLLNQWINGNIVEGVQGLEFHFTQAISVCSPGQRWLVASHLANISSLLVSVVGFVQSVLKTLLPFVKCNEELDNAITRILSVQKLGSYAYLQDSTSFIDPAVLSRRVSSGAISPIVMTARHSSLGGTRPSSP